MIVGRSGVYCAVIVVGRCWQLLQLTDCGVGYMEAAVAVAAIVSHLAVMSVIDDDGFGCFSHDSGEVSYMWQ